MPDTQDAATLSDVYDTAQAAEQTSEDVTAGSSTDQAGTRIAKMRLTTRAFSVVTVSA